MTTKPELSWETREILIKGGFMKPPKMSNPGPNVGDLLAKAAKKGFEVTLTATEGEEPDTMTVDVVVSMPDGSWAAESTHPGIALAEALAEAVRATAPRQATMEMEARS